MTAASARKIRLFVGAVGVVGGIATVAVLFLVADGSLGQPVTLLVLALAGGVAQAFPLLIVRDGEGEDVGFEEAVFVAMFLLLPAAGVLAAALASTTIGHLVRPKQPIKVVFNQGTMMLGTSVGIVAQRCVASPGRGSVTGPELLGAAVGVCVFTTVVAMLTWTAISLATGERFGEVAARALPLAGLAWGVSVAWGLVLATAARSSGAALVLGMAPLAVLRELQHADKDRRHLRGLLRTAAAAASAIRGGTVERAVLDSTGQLLAAGRCEIRPQPPGCNEIGSPIAVDEDERWLVVGGRHDRDPFKCSDQALLDGVAAIASVAIDNALLLEQAGHDPVTKLPFSTLFGERVALAVSRADTDGLAAVLVVKVDRLDVVKQTLGVDAATMVLAEIGARLTRLLDTAALADRFSTRSAGYLGGGEFALALTGLHDEGDAVDAAAVLVDAVRVPFSVEDVEVALSVSIGIAVQSTPATRPAGLVRDALAVASRIAKTGGDAIAVADPSGGERAEARLKLEAELRHAIERGDLVVHYQPELQVATGRVVGAEALVRWHHPTRGIVPPSEFIPLAEETGLIVHIDRLVLATACRQVSEWRSRLPGAEEFTVSVNLSARQLAQPDLTDFVSSVLQATGLQPDVLRLEVTESGVMHDTGLAVTRLRAIRELGIQLGIDDFGTGYSSLLYLRDFPVDVLKVDRSFVAGMAAESDDAAIVAATVRLAHALGLHVVAEGVETDDQLVQLRFLGCDFAQGYLWSPALPNDQFERWWENHRASAGDMASIAAIPAPELDGLADDRRDEVLAYLTHELRSPLTGIIGFTDLLPGALQAPNENVIGYLDAITRNALELADILDRLADARAVQLGTMQLRTEPLDLAALTGTVVHALQRELEPHELQLDACWSAIVVADPARLRQVIRNLLTNAAKFSPPDAPIEVTVNGGDSQVHLTVRDHGSGVPEHRRHELFRRFARLGNRAKGMGIGLHLSKAIVRAHGGDITYEPASGGGSAFTVVLPAADSGGRHRDRSLTRTVQ